jgi:hypothetical protein
VALETTGRVLALRERDEAQANLKNLNATLAEQVATQTEQIRLYGDIVQSSADMVGAWSGGNRSGKTSPSCT